MHVSVSFTIETSVQNHSIDLTADMIFPHLPNSTPINSKNIQTFTLVMSFPFISVTEPIDAIVSSDSYFK